MGDIYDICKAIKEIDERHVVTPYSTKEDEFDNSGYILISNAIETIKISSTDIDDFAPNVYFIENSGTTAHYLVDIIKLLWERGYEHGKV